MIRFMALVVALPVFAPLLCGALAAIVWRHPSLQLTLSFIGAATLSISSAVCLAATLNTGPIALQFGGWPVPFGIGFVADILSSTMSSVTGVIGLAAISYSRTCPDTALERAPTFLPLTSLMLAGTAGAFLTGDLFNLYVWFEVMLVSSFGLLVIGNRPLQVNGTMKYLVLNLIATTILLLAIALTYSRYGTLNLADIAVRAQRERVDDSAIAALFVFAFGLKAAIFPLYFWLPPAYPNSSVVVAAALAGLLTKVGVYGLYRIMTLVWREELYILAPVFAVASGLTMITGVLGAVASQEIRTILSFHIVSQIGYMIMPLAFPSAASLSGGIFYIVHHILVKSNLFFVAGLIAYAGGTSDLRRIKSGLIGTHPVLALLFVVPAASLAGIPPLSGFWAKLVLVDAGLAAEQGALVTIALITSALTLFSMTKIWQAAFWSHATANGDVKEDHANEVPAPRPSAWTLAPVVMLTLFTASIGLWPEPLAQLAERAANTLVDRRAYIGAVMGISP